MSQEKFRLPVKGGLDQARCKLKEMKKKDPSPALIKTIKEVTHRGSDKKPKTIIAAKPHDISLDS